jgi:hypothetical protein
MYLAIVDGNEIFWATNDSYDSALIFSPNPNERAMISVTAGPPYQFLLQGQPVALIHVEPDGRYVPIYHFPLIETTTVQDTMGNVATSWQVGMDTITPNGVIIGIFDPDRDSPCRKPEYETLYFATAPLVIWQVSPGMTPDVFRSLVVGVPLLGASVTQARLEAEPIPDAKVAKANETTKEPKGKGGAGGTNVYPSVIGFIILIILIVLVIAYLQFRGDKKTITIETKEIPEPVT